jgi:hypothetical protein
LKVERSRKHLPNGRWGDDVAKPRPPLQMSHVDGLAAEQCRGPADCWLPRHARPRGKRCVQRSRDYNGGASYQF